MPVGRGLVLGVVLALVLLVIPGQSKAGDPDLVYHTIKTEHFEIHYHQGLERTARVGAGIFEEVHLELSILFGWEIDGPTHIVVTDHTDSANGIAYVAFRPTIRLYVTAPNIGSSLQMYDNYLRQLFVHEYTHMISLRIHSGISRVVNAIFGDYYLPNSVAPRWYSEGIAVLTETYETTGGRIRTSQFHMTIRTAALEDTLLSLGEVSNSTRAYPRGSAHYIYGAMFMDYLHTRFGIEKIVDIFHEYGSAPIPYGLNRAFKKALGIDLITLYDDWTKQVIAKAEADRKRLTEKGLTSSRRLTSDGESKGIPVFLPDSEHVVLALANGVRKAGIYRISLNGEERERLVLSGSQSPISIDRSGRIFYARSAPFRTYYRFNDVFVLDRPGTEPRRVTHGARSMGAAISPRGDLLAMTVNDAGTTKLILADDRGYPIRTLVDSAPYDQVFSPVWSPDGETIAAVIRRGPELDLALISVRDGAIRFVTADRDKEESPTFDPSGRYLLYTSDRTGISNIYALDLAEDKLLQLTNVLTGATSPAVSPDGKTMAFIKYSSIGYDLHAMPFAPEVSPEAEPVESEWGTPKPTPAPSDAETEPYNPLPTMLPHYWMLNGSGDTEGNVTLQAVTALSDVVGRHSVGAEINYHIRDTVVSGRAAYSYGGLGPGIHAGISHTFNPRDSGYTVGGESRRWIQRITRGSLSLSYGIPGVDRNHGLSFGYSATYAKPHEEPAYEPDPREPSRPEIPSQYFRAGISMGWSFSETVSSALGVSPHDGRSLSANIELNHPSLGGTQTLATFRYGWSEYFAMPWLEHHALALRLSGGVHVSDPPEQASFSVGGYSEQNIVDTIWNNSPAGTPSLRGYPPGAFSGDQYHSLRLSYRMPVWFTEAAYATLPVFLKRIQAGVFTDNAVISFDTINREDWRSSLGGELVWVILIGYYQQMTVRTGYAYGFMDGGIHELILVIGGGF